jgi:RHS repeat-associated protein
MSFEDLATKRRVIFLKTKCKVMVINCIFAIRKIINMNRNSSYITNDNGQVTQALAYLPYSESRVELDNQPPYLTPYKFNGKEKDEETGFNYYGAGYYFEYLSVWLSVDPMSDKHPSLSSYVYCANNPVILTDPNGMEIGNYYDESGIFLKPDGIDDGKVYIYNETGILTTFPIDKFKSVK